MYRIKNKDCWKVSPSAKLPFCNIPHKFHQIKRTRCWIYECWCSAQCNEYFVSSRSVEPFFTHFIYQSPCEIRWPIWENALEHEDRALKWAGYCLTHLFKCFLRISHSINARSGEIRLQMQVMKPTHNAMSKKSGNRVYHTYNELGGPAQV